MKKSILKPTLFGVAMLAITASAQYSFAQTENERPPKGQGEAPKFADLLAKMDKNKDGKLAESEVHGPLKNDFAKVDKDKDGFITEKEFISTPPPPKGRKRD
jgi:EF hand